MDLNNVAFAEGLSKLVEAANNNKNVVEYDQIGSYFVDVELTEDVYEKIFEELENRRIDILKITEDDIDIVPIEELAELEETVLEAEELDLEKLEHEVLDGVNLEDPVRMYLNGEFGTDTNCVNSYAAASFYAVDRVASYLKNWKQDYEAGVLFVLDRYTTSNMVYMTSKLPKEDWDSFLSWLSVYEYDLLGLPRPDGVIYLDMPIEVSQKLMSKRYNSDESKKDLHEKNVEFLNSCRKSALFAAENQGWSVISCSENGEPRTIEDIASQVYSTACELLGI